jgi:hypothetical protein
MPNSRFAICSKPFSSDQFPAMILYLASPGLFTLYQYYRWRTPARSL